MPRGHKNIGKYCAIFMKGIVKSLYNEHVLSSLDIVDASRLQKSFKSKSDNKSDLIKKT